MKAHVDRDVCIGCGVCEGLCPDVFRMDDDNLSEVIVDEIPEDSEECAQEAQEECPVNCITVE